MYIVTEVALLRAGVVLFLTVPTASQGQCVLPTYDDVGSVANAVYADIAGDVHTPPTVQDLFQVHFTCLATVALDMYAFATVVAKFTTTSSSFENITQQFQLVCEGDAWRKSSTSYFKNPSTLPQMPFDIETQFECSSCEYIQGFADNSTYDSDSNCFFCASECRNIGGGFCTGITASDCCPFFNSDTGACVDNCKMIDPNFAPDENFACENSVQPGSVFVAANQIVTFRCIFNNANKEIPLPDTVVWLFNDSLVEEFPIHADESFETWNDEDDLEIIEFTIQIVMPSMSVATFNNTLVQCIALVINEDFFTTLSPISAILYVQGIPSAPSNVLVSFTKTKMYTQWTHFIEHDANDRLAYHISITNRTEYYPQDPVIPDIKDSFCFLYEVCVMEETIAGIGPPACINTSSNISLLGPFVINITNVSVLNHTNTSPSLVEVDLASCNDNPVEVHRDGVFHSTNFSVRNSTNLLELHLELRAPHNFTASDAMTLQINLLQPGVEDLQDVLIKQMVNGVEVSCLYAEASLVKGCLITLECGDERYEECSTVLFGNASADIFQICNLPCSTGSLYGYAYSHGIVAENASIVMENIKFDKILISIISASALPDPTNTNFPNAIGPLHISLIFINIINAVLICSVCISIVVVLVHRKYKHSHDSNVQ